MLRQPYEDTSAHANSLPTLDNKCAAIYLLAAVLGTKPTGSHTALCKAGQSCGPWHAWKASQWSSCGAGPLLTLGAGATALSNAAQPPLSAGAGCAAAGAGCAAGCASLSHVNGSQVGR